MRYSVAHKLYGVVGIMALLVATELFTLMFAMNTLSAVRAFVGGEGIWSKAQKDALLELQRYVRTRDESHYLIFKEHLAIPLGDHQAREEMQKPNMNMALVREGFLAGQIHPSDIDPMVKLITRFHWVSYINQAIDLWGQGDEMILKLIASSEDLHVLMQAGYRDEAPEVQILVKKISVINAQLTQIENQFSSVLGEASRWLERILMGLLMCAVATVETTGLLLTIRFGRRMTKVLNELRDFSNEIGEGNFSNEVPVRSRDELGELAKSLNKMASNLKETTSERLTAERANRVKSLFLANMSHEIRTPLNAILGFADLLKDQSLTVAERQKYLEIIERTGGSLSTIINDILDISKVEAGRLEIDKVNCSMTQILRDLESLLRMRCEEKGIALHFQTKNLPEWVITDSTRLKQILTNVIGNSIKFTNQGGVSTYFEIRGSILYCTVKDTGVGIAPENIDKLFRPFSQVDLSIRKQFGGTGLGLILSKRLAQLMGGDVRLVESRPGRGSTFEICLKLEPALGPALQLVKKEIPLPRPEPLSGKRILVVEDSLDNQLLAQQYLVKEGAIVEFAQNGQESIEAFGRAKYDVILMDMQMPVMDGYTATARLRQLGCHVPIIALTAHAMKEDLRKCLSVGCDDYLSKPFRRDHLLTLVRQHCRSSGNPVQKAA